MSGDLRAAVEGLYHRDPDNSGYVPAYSYGRNEALAALLVLIPEGAVLALPGDTIVSAEDAEGGTWVTEETLNAAIHASHFHGRQMAMTDAEADAWLAAAILRHLREGTK